MSTLINDTKYGIRQLWKCPGFTVVAIVSLALGIGSGAVLEVQFTVEIPVERLPAISGSTLALPSPWLSGIPVEDSYDQEYLADLAWWVVCTGERMLTTGQLYGAG